MDFYTILLRGFVMIYLADSYASVNFIHSIREVMRRDPLV